MKNILFIDNFDSFTYNLVDEFRKREYNVEVYRNNISIAQLEQVMKKTEPRAIVISPGPSSPKDAGNCIEMVKRFYRKLPIFGVCLGHQIIIEAFGGKVERASEQVHGKSSPINHDSRGIFKDLPNPLTVGRYHSLCGTRIPKCLERTAEYNGINMGVRHRSYPIEGVQFHPESILTSTGGKMIENLLHILR